MGSTPWAPKNNSTCSLIAETHAEQPRPEEFGRNPEIPEDDDSARGALQEAQYREGRVVFRKITVDISSKSNPVGGPRGILRRAI